MTVPLASLALLASVAVSDADLRARAQSIVSKSGYQTTLPVADAPAAAATPAAGGTRTRRERQPRVGGPGLPTIPLGVLWPVLGAIGIAGLMLVLWRVVEARRARDVPARDREPRGDAAPVRRSLRIGPLTDVEDLARQGRFGEAIHLLLLHLFAALQRRPATAPAPAHTGREVLARTRLASQAHEALGVLVLAGEKIHFGGRPASREDYEACLAHYRRFLDSFERAS